VTVACRLTGALDRIGDSDDACTRLLTSVDCVVWLPKPKGGSHGSGPIRRHAGTRAVASRQTGCCAFLGCSEHGTHRPYLRLTAFRGLTTHNEYCNPIQIHRRLAPFCHNIVFSFPQTHPAALILPYSVLLIPDDRQALGTPTSSTTAAAASRNQPNTNTQTIPIFYHLSTSRKTACCLEQTTLNLSPTLTTTRTAICVG
jgi:hypothetical protein